MPAVDGEVNRINEYANEKVHKVLFEMVENLFVHKPEDPVQFMIDFLEDFKKRTSGSQMEPNSIPPRKRRRGAVSAEPVDSILDTFDDQSYVLPNSTPLHESQKSQVHQILERNLLFSGLDSDTLEEVVNNVMIMEYEGGETIIGQGDDGNHLFVLIEGTCDCYVRTSANVDAMLVKSYVPGESFGELALMYNSPRAATIKASSDVITGVIDRVTFHKSVMESTSKKRTKYEEFLSRVEVLKSLDKYERATIADALAEVTFSDGDLIIKKGDPGNDFFIIWKGAAKVTKMLLEDRGEEIVMDYKIGDYFGELALLNNSPRAANVVAVGAVTCVRLDRDSFERLLGPIKDIIGRSREAYEQIERQITTARIEAISGGQVVGTPQGYRRGRRQGVSSEPSEDMKADMEMDWVPTIHSKSSVQHQRLVEAVQSNLLFKSLPDETMETVVNAMFEVKKSAGSTIITQGEDGDNFYVLESGICDCYLNKPQGKEPLLVKTYEHGESFGELALMYNAPRAASIKARTDVVMWAMDRLTFRRVMMDTTSRKRKMYEGFLESVPLLAGLDKYERSKIADALEERTFQDGEYVIRMGDPGDTFYVVSEGKCTASKPIHIGGPSVTVMQYTRGAYFGELALLNDIPRSAHITANGPLKCVSIDRSSFTRLLGPVSDILKRNEAKYKRQEELIKSGLSE
eukprot:766226_1